MARFFLPRKQIHDGHGNVEGQELEHLRKVLRLKVGDRITVFDDGGWEHDAVILSLSETQGRIEILHSSEAQRESPLQITLAVALTKGDKLDFVVEKATELGVQKIVPFASAFAVPKLDARKIAARTERWQKIALSATKQCGRTRVPEVEPLCSLPELLARSELAALKLFFWEKESERSLRHLHGQFPSAQTMLLTIGPEGGFSADEVELARRCGFEIAHLGRRILRAETAALTALSLVQFLWGDLA
ncbi:MAG: 16S rRNA (uracil(1498)-N(3))-methyltransferase [Deltaproteobacteria bacterium]|nr:16S rRNA (uracil(1498)-N(3))-methyltransferase [Deltaproteobacteria bacterium]